MRPEFLPSICVFQVFEAWTFETEGTKSRIPHFGKIQHLFAAWRDQSHPGEHCAGGRGCCQWWPNRTSLWRASGDRASEKQRFPWDGEPLRWIDSFWYAIFFSLTRRCAVEGFCTHELVWYNTVLFAGISVLLLVPPRNPLSINWIERLLVGLSRWFGRATLKAFTWHRKHARTSLPTTVWGF